MGNLSIDIMLTHNCNFRCTYCYEKDCNYDNMNMSEETISDVTNYVDWWLKENPRDTIKLNFWGGEPSLRIGSIKYFVDKYFDDDRVSFLTFTNGYLIEPLIEIGKRFNGSERFFLQISYDFYGQKNRIFAGGHPTKTLVKESIKRVSDSGIFFSIKSTISIEDLPQIFNYYQEFKQLEQEIDKDLSLAITPDTTMTWNKSEEEFDKLIEDFKVSLKKTLKSAVENKEKNFNWLSGSRQLCSAGNNYFCIDIDGKVYPCHGSVFLKDKENHVLGNIKELKNFNFEFSVFEEPFHCEDCDACLCFRCNAHIYEQSMRKNYKDKWMDFGCNYDYCRIQKEISKISYAYKKITTGTYV